MFSKKIYSLRTNLIIILLLMGLLGISLSIYTGSTYKEIALKEHQQRLLDSLSHEVNKQVMGVLEKNHSFALSILKEDGFYQVVNNGELRQLELAKYTNHYPATKNASSVERLIVYDEQLAVIAMQPPDTLELSNELYSCLVADISGISLTNNSGSQKPINRLCLFDERLLISTITPIIDKELIGYLQVIVDPLYNFQLIEKHLSQPISIDYLNGRRAYRSDNWPQDIEGDDSSVVQFILKNSQNEAIISFRVTDHDGDFYQLIQTTKRHNTVAASLMTLALLILALLWLNRTALTPIANLTKHFHKIRTDRTYLGKKIDASGNREIFNLIEDFNAVSNELFNVYEELEKVAFTDSLTGLPNRELFYDRLNQLVLIQNREQKPIVFSVFMMDLDRFKYVNDTLGHHVGDLLLKQVSARIKGAVRECDTIARLGGDEFAALLPKINDKNGAQQVAQRISDALLEPFIINGHNLQAAASIGIVMYPMHGNDQHELLQRADVAMYHAKNNQMNYAFYEQSIDKNNVLELTLQSELKLAIETGALQLFYQPKIVIENNEVHGVEALLRWFHPERGFISPDDFITMSEQTGLIHPLTEWVLHTAIKQAKEWHDSGVVLNMAINISAESLRAPGFDEMVDKALNEVGLTAEYLTLELTEGAVMTNPERALQTLELIDSKGVKLSIDDFGTGYSSLAYLKKLPMNEIKIDRSFVIDMDSDKSDEVIVQSTIDLAHNMGLKVVAEGIETEQSWNTLKRLGCDMGQGYYMCRPISADSFIKWFNGHRTSLSKTNPN